MFSKTVLPVLGALAGTVAANPIQRAVAEAAANPPQVIFSPAGPINTGKAVSGHEDLTLLQEDNFYWAHAGEAGLPPAQRAQVRRPG
ncbi:hypothetical protein NLG97_g5142 [Lecanicillium saksenae]|uniref:Uncharacterized protein n=1 Tax=Lecanicillium saksenae TaxID=468837 RepID=A0ACC1QVS1_9HYPO|nr:hypothetical protein NLG97_g5142 [Lecanicillium saksenae]